ncbi:hypothetical protein BDV59DRAFT_119015 [Aspergillus ambiguus]|uniref:uncharacterized protein n=1 Tax=Aspergillus ambiguus TaxID=176160 RepID=UPI003CCE30C9
MPYKVASLFAPFRNLLGGKRGDIGDSKIDSSKYHESDIITRDVCIVGGGAAGTFAAIRLQQHDKSFVVIEKEARLGGQTMTYMDPRSGMPVEYGVTFFPDLPVVREYFTLLGLPIIPSHWTLRMEYFDFRTGEPIRMAATPDDREAALKAYRAKLEEYPYLQAGLYLPHPVPEDLLLPFGDFIEKYNLRALLPLFGGMNFLGDWLRQPALYAMKFWNIDFVDGFSQTGFLKPGTSGNSAIYAAAQGKLGANVLLSSHVVRMDRTSDRDYVYVEVRTGVDERIQLIRAKKVIFTIPPLPAAFKDFDPSEDEKKVFSRFQHTYCYTAVVKTKGLPTDMCYLNRGVGFQHPRLPCVLTIRPSLVEDLRTLHIGSNTPLSEEDVRREIVSSFRGCQLADPEIMVLGNHSPYQLTVPVEAIADGFYRSLNALQGSRRSYYVGAAFESHNSRPIWTLVDQLLQNDILPSLK